MKTIVSFCDEFFRGGHAGVMRMSRAPSHVRVSNPPPIILTSLNTESTKAGLGGKLLRALERKVLRRTSTLDPSQPGPAFAGKSKDAHDDLGHVLYPTQPLSSAYLSPSSDWNYSRRVTTIHKTRNIIVVTSQTMAVGEDHKKHQTFWQGRLTPSGLISK